MGGALLSDQLREVALAGAQLGLAALQARIENGLVRGAERIGTAMEDLVGGLLLVVHHEALNVPVALERKRRIVRRQELLDRTLTSVVRDALLPRVGVLVGDVRIAPHHQRPKLRERQEVRVRDSQSPVLGVLVAEPLLAVAATGATAYPLPALLRQLCCRLAACSSEKRLCLTSIIMRITVSLALL